MASAQPERDVRGLLDLAVQKGVAVAKVVAPSSVVTGEWVRLKCQFGCDGWGQCLTCPPHSPTPAAMRRTLDEYRRIILLHLPKECGRLKEIAVSLEREAFLQGFYKALAVPSGPCHFCKECRLEHPCANPDKARPSMEACGIDVYQTARNAGFHIEPLPSRDCTAIYFSLLLLD